MPALPGRVADAWVDESGGGGGGTTVHNLLTGRDALSAHPIGAITDLAAELAALIPLAQKAASNGVATLDGTGKIPAGQIPALALSEFLGTVASEAAMLALVGQRGDWCIRTDLDPDRVFILESDDPTQAANWTDVTGPLDLYIPKSIGDGKGELIGFSAADNPVRIPAGVQGQLATYDSAQASGIGATFAGRDLATPTVVTAWDNDVPVDGAFGTTTNIDLAGAVITLPATYDGGMFFLLMIAAPAQTVASRFAKFNWQEGATVLDAFTIYLPLANIQGQTVCMSKPLQLSAGTHTIKVNMQTFTSGTVYLLNGVALVLRAIAI